MKKIHYFDENKKTFCGIKTLSRSIAPKTFRLCKNCLRIFGSRYKGHVFHMTEYIDNSK